MQDNIFDFFEEVLQKFSIQQIADELGLHKGTLKRWNELKEVPPQYYFDLCRIAGVEVNYDKYSAKEKDQFFTSIESAKYCINKAREVLSDHGTNIDEYTLIEPSVGDGSFYNLLPENSRLGVDIESRLDDVVESDFLLWKPETGKNICIGNPPFGLRGHLALKFINHASQFSDYVCFILPQLFDSNGKGSCKSRVKNMGLIHSEIISSDFHYPDGKQVNVNVVFQVWSKKHKVIEEKVDYSKYFKLYSLSDGGTSGSTRNKKHLYTCDYYLPSTCFGGDKIRIYNYFEDLPNRRGYGIVIKDDKAREIVESISWEDQAFVSTNGAYNLRFDIIEKSIGNFLPKENSGKLPI